MDIQTILQDDLKETLAYTFSVYLNQSLNAIYIDLETEDTEVSYTIYDKKGQIIKSCHNLSRRNKLSLNSFPSGVYKVEVMDDLHKITKEVLRF
ncbi:Por secretion system C-terminal sorting domain-containing protein [Aquimarina amphilecti]|uniref:Por secretion system C-terminal sorting domain-containing protein n=1 Tax=Aquimarina amphilecti TaxID=1038014 RepID=A0A1H7PHP7_AQUAM|nr:T9SS type A sorting domain-containing protein [Aquimarina amphilecti]SEL34567.1 Por secretion system C-terminal sorting domain-containing protein [Aquimarina amphilecti]